MIFLKKKKTQSAQTRVPFFGNSPSVQVFNGRDGWAINVMAVRTVPIWKATNLHQSATTQNNIIVIALAAIEKRATKNAPPCVYVARV